MDSSLDLVTRLSVESEYKSLYRWSLKEFKPGGEEVTGPLIPWDWTLYFRARDFRRIHSAGLDRYSEEKRVAERDFIKCNLESIGGEFQRPVSYSMFGTKRRIELLTLQVHRLLEMGAEERCLLGGNIEWIYKEEFSSRQDIVPDELYVAVYIQSERFDRLLDAIGDGASAELTLWISGVSGFYSHWSPDIKTSSIKVLTDQGQHEPEMPEGCPIRPPVLGTVRQFDVSVVRTLRAEPPPTEREEDDEPAETLPEPHQRALDVTVTAVLARLDQLKYTLWCVLVVLVLLLVFKH